MLKTFAFPAFTPDIPLTTADISNLVPTSTGYKPVGQFSQVAAPLAGILGGGGYTGLDGTTALLGGTASDLYSYAGGAWSSVLSGLSAASWRFDQFGGFVIGVNGGAPVKYEITSGSAAALDGSPPTSDLVATVRDQLFLAGDPDAVNQVAISSYNDPTGWTPGTNQCLYVPFPSGGRIMGLCGGETAVILQQRSVKLATYNGDGVTWWQFDEISRDIGCMAKGSVAQAGGLVFFLSDQGFCMCDRTKVIPIGVEKVDATFFRSYQRVDIIENIRCSVDPQSTTVHWSMPGTPGRIWSYNWTLDKWFVIEVSLKFVFQGFTSNVTLEELDAMFPSGLDLMPYSLDASIFAGGNPMLFTVNSEGAIGTMTGDNMAAYIRIPPIEVEKGYRVQMRNARLIGDMIEGAFTIDARARAGDDVDNSLSRPIRANGNMPIRANGRHVAFRVDLPAAARWSYLNGFDLEYERTGSR